MVGALRSTVKWLTSKLQRKSSTWFPPTLLLANPCFSLVPIFVSASV
jgi:hypothetical protein